MKIKIKENRVYENSPSYGENKYFLDTFISITIIFGIITSGWLIYTIAKFISWEPLNWIYFRFTIFVLILTIIYLLTFFKITKTYEK